MPWNELSQLDPAIVTREFAAKGQKEVDERELMTRLPRYMWKTLGSFWTQIGPFAHILASKSAVINCTAAGLALFGKPWLIIK